MAAKVRRMRGEEMKEENQCSYDRDAEKLSHLLAG